ncbi:universal stress protein UspA [Alteribacter lacisalsi]|uniref:Universal stress protein n=1 Tax=Alteribacter lacisalsi TaxID=2045244 RepID=A0A2W0HU97_9BACI|nr:universal stress protein [Alteribacter lacisalsi]PYZ97208.1 universal stress protein UspA [Alteribacter lacisalsi]
MAIRYQNILVAVDGSDEAQIALRKASELAKEYGSTLFITHIVDTRAFASVEYYDRTIAAEAEEYASAMLERYKKAALENSDVTNVKLITDYGSPKVKIAKEIATKHQIDLIVTGATGLNAVERFLIGSVSEYITRHAKCDVLIVRSEPADK